MRLWMLVVAGLALGVVGGCGGEDEPSEIPKSPPPGKSLPRFVEATSDGSSFRL